MEPSFTCNPDPSSGFLTVFIDSEQYTITAENVNFRNAIKFLSEKNWEELKFVLNPTLKFNSLYAQYENIIVKDGNVTIDGEMVNGIIASRIINLMANNIDCTPIFKFMTRLQLNPSKRAVDELYTFLEHRNLPITSNGTIQAYKAVRVNYTDCHTGTYDNTVGNTLQMPRNKVDDNKDVGCSHGFHAGTFDYAKDFMPSNGHLLIVEIDPADVVSIPTDCNFQKLRTCKYKVTQEYNVTLDENKIQDSYLETDNDTYVNQKWENKPLMMDVISVSDVVNLLDKWGEDEAVQDIKKISPTEDVMPLGVLKDTISENLFDELMEEFEEQDSEEFEPEEQDSEEFEDDDDEDSYEEITVDLSSHIDMKATLKNLDEAQYVKLKNALEKEYKDFESVQMGEVLKYIDSIYDDSDYIFDILLQYKVDA